MVRVLFADDRSVVRDGIRRILERDPMLHVVGEASDFSEAIQQGREFRPDIMILNVHMPFEPGLSLRELSLQLGSCKAGIVGFSFAQDEYDESFAMHLGAEELLDCIQLNRELIPAVVRVASARNGLHDASPRRI